MIAERGKKMNGTAIFKSNSTGKTSANKPGRGFIYELKKNKTLFLLAFPGMLFILVNNYLPMFGIVLAFEDYKFKTGFFSKFVGLKNFEYLFNSPNAFIITRNTLLYNFVFIFMGLVFAVVFALILSEITNRLLAKFYQSVLFLPFFLSYVVVTYLVYVFLSKDNGFLNKTIIPILGMEPVDWYSSPQYWPYILTIVNLWKTVGYSTVIYLAGITGIDNTYYDAALIDGASKFQQIRYITVPFLKPLMLITTILALGNIFRADFGLFYQVPQDIGVLYPVTDVIDTYVYRSLATMGDVGMSSAAGFYQSIVGFITVMLANIAVRKIDRENALF